MRTMTKYSIIIPLLLLMCSCKDTSKNTSNNGNLDNIKINNKTLEGTIDRFIVNASVYATKKGKDICHSVYVREWSNTISQNINRARYESKNTKGYEECKGYKLFYIWEHEIDAKIQHSKMFIPTERKVTSCESYIDTP